MQFVLNESVKDRMQGNGGSSQCISMIQVELDMPAVYPSLVGKRLHITNGMEGNGKWVMDILCDLSEIGK